jgi:hypothetical protein
VEVASDSLGWKIKLLRKKFKVSFKNKAFQYIDYRMLNGPNSIRALVWPHKYNPFYSVNELTGQIQPDDDPKNEVESYLSSMMGHLKSISLALDQFEMVPDEGFIGKTIYRFPYYVWQIAVRGLLITPIKIITFPLIVCLNLFVSSLALLFLPLYVRIIEISKFMFNVAIHRPSGVKRELWFPLINHVLNILVFGVGQVALAVTAATVFHPAMALYWFLHAYLMEVIRKIRDFAFFYLLIKPFGRIPSANSLIIERKKGPGIGANYVFTIKPELALLILQVYLENAEMDEYLHDTNSLIMEPELKLLHFHKQVLSHFYSSIDYSNIIMKTIQIRNNEIENSLEELVKIKVKERLVRGNISNLKHISQTPNDQAITIKKARYVIRKWYTQNIFKYMDSKEEREHFWDKQRLSIDDWDGLTRVILKDLFGENFFSSNDSVEMNSNILSLEVSHKKATDYALELWRPLFHNAADTSQIKLDRLPFEKIKPVFIYPKVTIQSALSPPKAIQQSFQVWQYGKNEFKSGLSLDLEEES